MAALAEQQHFPEHQWAYDGHKILYTARMFLPQAETVYEVSRLFAISVPMHMLNLTPTSIKELCTYASLLTGI